MLRRISPIHKQGRLTREQEELMQSLRTAQNDLSSAYLAFDDITDPELVESCIFEIRSLQAKINYLLRALKTAEEPQPVKKRQRSIAAALGGGRKRWV